MTKLKELMLIPVMLGGTASIDPQGLEGIVNPNKSEPEYSLSYPSNKQINQQQNGYLDYMAASDFLTKNDFEKKSEVMFAEIGSKKSTFLRSMRSHVTAFKGAIDLVKQGNKKQVYHVEVADYNKMESNLGYLTVLLFADSYQNFAAGNNSAGMQSLTDTLVFCENIARSGGTRSYVYGNSARYRLVFNEMEELLPRLSQPNLKKLEDFSKEVLKYDTTAEMIRRQLPQQLGLIDRVISGDFSGLTRRGNVLDEEIAKTVAEQVSKLNPAQRQELKEIAGKALTGYVGSLLETLSRPEGEWKPIAPPDLYLPPFGNLNPLLDAIGAPPGPPILQIAMEHRTRYRLLLLHSKIEQYRWENHELPATLDELKDLQAILDPLSGGKFEYKKKESRLGYDLYSNGSKNHGFQTGKIFLSSGRRE
ncbi:MAG TPA: hypothetical protein HA282_00155 [Nanoarchaeota archaeon]|nr:hypothetical protein [Candidatus Pacearchaeota archaeon]HIH17325.1 hypothetical protein [Nanoarchaeota archaeon]HIH34185.1 hypothetical protein [Nanoarchaeota archaeon]HIH65613.1 hypothetical protein [Nanoarchaeota archaeon]